MPDRGQGDGGGARGRRNKTACGQGCQRRADKETLHTPTQARCLVRLPLRQGSGTREGAVSVRAARRAFIARLSPDARRPRVEGGGTARTWPGDYACRTPCRAPPSAILDLLSDLSGAAGPACQEFRKPVTEEGRPCPPGVSWGMAVGAMARNPTGRGLPCRRLENRGSGRSVDGGRRDPVSGPAREVGPGALPDRHAARPATEGALLLRARARRGWRGRSRRGGGRPSGTRRW